MNTKRLLAIVSTLVLSAIIGAGLSPTAASAKAPNRAGARINPRESLVLVRNGVPASTIVVADDADWWHRQAAGWLQDYIERATGAKLPIVGESESPAGTLISVGHTKLAGRAGITTDDLKWDGCKTIVKGNVLFLLGRDSTGIGRGDPTPTEMKDYTEGDPWRPDRPWGSMKAGLAGANGTCKAVVTFLEDVCGVRWFMPFEQGIHVPRQADLIVKRNLNKTVQPAFAYGTGMFAYGSPRLSPAAFANNFRYGIRLKTFGGHSWYRWVPAGHFKEHPEYFAMINGKRTAAGGHLCTTNLEVRKLLLKGIRAQFDAGYEWVQLGQTDGWKRCECPTCEAQDNFRPYDKKLDGPDWWRWLFTVNRDNPVERIHLLHNWVAQEAAKSHPGKVVHFLAYIPTRWPSKKIGKYSPNVVAELCHDIPQMIEDWSSLVKGMTVYKVWWDMSWVYGYSPDMGIKEVADEIRFYHDKGVIGFFCGGDAHNWGLNGPLYYLLGKMLGNPNVNEYEVVREYCHGVYGDAGQVMDEFFTLLYNRPLRKDKTAPNTPYAQTIRDRFPPNVIRELEELLIKAEAIELSKPLAGNLRATRFQFNYIKLVSYMWVAYEAYQISPTRASLGELKRRVDDFEKYRMMILNMKPGESSKWFPDLGSLSKWFTSSSYFGRWDPEKVDISASRRGTPLGYYAKIREPLTLDFEALAKELSR